MAPNPKQLYGDKKPPLGQVPLTALIHGALAFYDGKGKYGDRNWRKNPVQAQTYVEAILRHVLLWANGEEFARDTGVHNLGGVIASAGLLLDAQANGVLLDNRVKSQAACDLLHDAEATITSLNEQHKARREAQEMAEQKADTEADDREHNKRAQAATALRTLQDLQDEWWNGTGPEQAALEPRIRAAQDVILNMVNGVFPEPVTVDVPLQTFAWPNSPVAIGVKLERGSATPLHDDGEDRSSESGPHDTDFPEVPEADFGTSPRLGDTAPMRYRP